MMDREGYLVEERPRVVRWPRTLLGRDLGLRERAYDPHRDGTRISQT